MLLSDLQAISHFHAAGRLFEESVDADIAHAWPTLACFLAGKENVYMKGVSAGTPAKQQEKEVERSCTCFNRETGHGSGLTFMPATPVLSYARAALGRKAENGEESD